MSDVIPIVVIALACVGLIFVLFVVIIYVIYWKNKLLKASGRELSVVILIGCIFAFGTCFPAVMKVQ